MRPAASGQVGLGVYEAEEDLFCQDLSSHVIEDDLLARLLAFPDVLVTAQQAFFTREALRAICADGPRRRHRVRGGAARRDELF